MEQLKKAIKKQEITREFNDQLRTRLGSSLATWEQMQT
jgi:hypothetical protein